jgi:hypothetical protein
LKIEVPVKLFAHETEISSEQIEYATDIVFSERGDLQRLYEPLIRTAVKAIKSDDVARSLGRKQVQGDFNGELDTNFGTRIEGTRLKHHIVASTPSADFATATFGVTSACGGSRVLFASVTKFTILLVV